MMKKILPLLFTVLCLLLCVIPSLGMIVAPSTQTIGNERLAEFPSLQNEDGSLNGDYPEQAGDYLSKRFALRAQAVDLDARIQAGVFSDSNLGTVTVGSDGWLYYASSLDDYLGRNTLSRREINGIVHNLLLAQEYVESQGGSFLFTIAPNKNTLYPEHMPYFDNKAASDVRNRDLFRDAVSDSGLNYCDLFELFQSQDVVLYLKQDSHWNNKGALLAYNAMLDAVGKSHDDYSSAQVKRAKDFYGDLGKMIYPTSQKPEYNYYYDVEETYSYTTPTKSVEEGIIKTENPSKSGSLYMYRDSFGNALLPYFANAYSSAYFTKAYPVNLAFDTSVFKADTVIFEIAERNMVWFLERPPVMLSPQRDLGKLLTDAQTQECEAITIDAKKSQVNSQYIALSGSLDGIDCDDDAVVYLTVSGDDCLTRTYEAFDTKGDGGDGFVANIPAADYKDKHLTIEVTIGTEGQYQVCQSAVDTINL